MISKAMTYDEFQRQLGKAGLTIKEFASLVRMNKNSITNCASKGEVPAHLAVIALLMAELTENRIDFRNRLLNIAISPKKPRGSAQKGRFGGQKEVNMDLFTVTGDT